MTTTRTLTTLAILPVLAAAGHGVATAAPGQPGLAVPGEGQPGLSTAPPAPAQPSLADYIPDPPAPPARPRPQAQTKPQADTLVQQPPTTQREDQESEAPLPENEPPTAPANPHTLRAGNTTVPVPEWVDTKTRDKAQAYLDYAEWQIAAGYDTLGFSRQESDRRAASTITGGVLSAVAGAELISVPAAGIGCAVGAAVGGIAGGIIGTGAAGVGAPFGAGLGAGLGCLAGVAVGAVPGIAVGATAGAVLGGATAGALGGGVDVPKPDVPPLIEVAAVPLPAEQNPVDQPLANAVVQVGAQIGSAVESLRSAIATMPPLIPDPALLFGQPM
ncbi:hypothetical protein [Nocardia sp. NPDC056100]|uniref:hypothetical protein n=1 Tax=Nocardia sp. NPDC056100 TaxID=3345712 RepID=UPI0035E20C25